MSEDELRAAQAAFRAAQSVYRGDHDHFPLTLTWENCSDKIREGWCKIAKAALAANSSTDSGRAE